MKILYFAWLRQKVGKDFEDVVVPKNVSNVAGLIDWLKGRNEVFADALADFESIRVAVNHEFAELDSPVIEGDEVAFFPPMTGG